MLARFARVSPISSVIRAISIKSRTMAGCQDDSRLPSVRFGVAQTPKEKIQLITRNLQVNMQLVQHVPSSYTPLSRDFIGSSWRRQVDPTCRARKRCKDLLGHSNDRKATRGLLCSYEQDSRFPEGRM